MEESTHRIGVTSVATRYTGHCNESAFMSVHYAEKGEPVSIFLPTSLYWILNFRDAQR